MGVRRERDIVQASKEDKAAQLYKMADTYTHLPIKLVDSAKSTKCLCQAHEVEICEKCNIDVKTFNNFYKAFNAISAPIPPPPNSVTPQRSMQINKLKDRGNDSFRKKDFEDAMRCYNLAIAMAAGRPVWEPSALARDELVILLCNRSAANQAQELWPEALADAEVVVNLKPIWPKGHYRKAKALIELGRLEAARDAVSFGLA